MTTQAQLDAILHGAAFAEITDRAFLRVTGTDATRWLNGMVTNNIKDLKPGEGNYNFLLNAQGRIQGDCTIYCEYREPESGDPRFLLETDTGQLETIQQLLDKFIVMDDVELAAVSDRSGILLVGQDAAAHLAAIDLSTEPSQPFEWVKISWHSAAIDLFRTHSPLVPAYEIWSNPDTSFVVEQAFRDAATAVASTETLEAFRIYSGIPKYGIDIRDRDLPQETAQSHALHFAKGCYLGQEIVERIRSRGQVHRTFTRFNLTGSLPTELPAPLEANAKPVGEITSATQIGDTLYALGYARREALDTHATLTYPGGTATSLANWNTGKLETGS